MDDKRFRALNQRYGVALELAYLAELDEMYGKTAESEKKYHIAFETVHAVAQDLVDTDVEPMRSEIYWNAASLAIECGEPREAEKLIATALAGDPLPTIANELRELLMQIVPQLIPAARA